MRSLHPGPCKLRTVWQMRSGGSLWLAQPQRCMLLRRRQHLRRTRCSCLQPLQTTLWDSLRRTSATFRWVGRQPAGERGDAASHGAGAPSLLGTTQRPRLRPSRPVQAEYAKLQALYEDLKTTKIDEEVAQLLEQQNRHVSEHGQKAAQMAEHYKAEVW